MTKQIDSSFSESDVSSLKKHFKTLYKCAGPPPAIPPFMSPEISVLTGVPREEAQTRLGHFVAVVNLVSALMLSGVSTVALEGLDVSQLDVDMQPLGNAVVILTGLNAAINAGTVLFTCFILTALAVETNATILRTVARSGCLVLYQYFIVVSGITFAMAVALQSYISATGRAKAAGAAIVTLTFLAIFAHGMMKVLPTLFPYSAVRWLPSTLLLRAPEWCVDDARRLNALRLRDAAQVHGEAVVEEAAEEITGEVDGLEKYPGRTMESDPSDGEGAPDLSWTPAEVEEMQDFLQTALPRSTTERRQAIADLLLQEDLFVSELEAASEDTLYTALGEESFVMPLKVSERLAICSASRPLPA